ncbi:hypothetical protein CN404_24495 [Bacillus thuringiensis]|nr:hypothetical protein CN404_24495 [Bacillus thuringiensis]
MVKEFDEAAHKLKKGEISAPVKTQHGYHIIKITDTNADKTFDQAKADIKKELVQEKAQNPEFMNKVTMKEIKAADVKVKDTDLKNLFEEPKVDTKQDEKNS